MRIRTIKPEFWQHEGLSRLPEFTRLLAIALLNWADDEGYFLASPALIRGSLFPFLDDSRSIPGALQELSNVGFIRLGNDTQERIVGMVINFARHQQVNKPRPSKIKGLTRFPESSGTPPGDIWEVSREEWNGMEQGSGKGMEGSGARPIPAGAPASLEEALTWAAGYSKGNAEMLVINDAWVRDWFDERSSAGWERVSGGLQIPITDWKPDCLRWCRREAKFPKAIGSSPGFGPQKKEGGAGFEAAPAVRGTDAPEGWERAMQALWGDDWERYSAAWETMLPADQAQVRAWLKKNEGGSQP